MGCELYKLKVQVAVLKEVAKEYGTCTITNAITQMELRIKEVKSKE